MVNTLRNHTGPNHSCRVLGSICINVDDLEYQTFTCSIADLLWNKKRNHIVWVEDQHHPNNANLIPQTIKISSQKCDKNTDIELTTV